MPDAHTMVARGYGTPRGEDAEQFESKSPGDPTDLPERAGWTCWLPFGFNDFRMPGGTNANERETKDEGGHPLHFCGPDLSDIQGASRVLEGAGVRGQRQRRAGFGGADERARRDPSGAQGAGRNPSLYNWKEIALIAEDDKAAVRWQATMTCLANIGLRSSTAWILSNSTATRLSGFTTTWTRRRSRLSCALRNGREVAT